MIPWKRLSHLFFLFGAAVLGGALNAVAGGGSFVGFPSLLFTGLPPIQANATNTIALWPGSLASVGAYWRELAQQKRGFLLLLVGSSLVGGMLGSLLLLRTPQETLFNLIPYLLLGTTVLFACRTLLTTRLRWLVRENKPPSVPTLAGGALAQLAIALYGGYFGGGLGILLLAILAIMGMENVHQMNSLKTLLTSCINGVAVVTFLCAGTIAWPQAIVMISGAILGGYGGAFYGRKIEQRWVRLLVILVGFSLTLYFFVLQKVRG
ncbi:sulfite exporter TauE/SafE family protein [Ktedonobacter racemifer]|nr:sulfite exporter TauE/SafE family protein [Ktedonobacter racemifer]